MVKEAGELLKANSGGEQGRDGGRRRARELAERLDQLRRQGQYLAILRSAQERGMPTAAPTVFGLVCEGMVRTMVDGDGERILSLRKFDPGLENLNQACPVSSVSPVLGKFWVSWGGKLRR